MAKSQSGSAEPYLSGRPKHLVVFREPASKNVSIMSKLLSTGEAKGVSARATCSVLGAHGGVHTRVYNRLGIAVANLDSEEISKLREMDAVQDVVPNERRTIPPEVVASEIGSGAVKMVDPTISYLQGMRDAIDSMLRRLGAESGSPTPSPNLMMGAAAADPSHSWCLDLIGIPSGYSVATGKDVVVAVLDTGLDLNHPDFANRVTEEDTAKSFIPGESVQDGNGHGTHCVGTVCGPVSPASGKRYGVAPAVELLVGKVLSNAGFGYDDQILDGIDWAADHSARVISMSLGSERALGQPFPMQYERVAESLLQSRVLIIAAAGNSSNRPFFVSPVENPASCPSIMAVAAVDRYRQVASFSCAQLDAIGAVDISGPGVAVYSSWTGGGYRSISGTSMATPHVAGVAALYWEKNPDVTAQAIWNLLTGLANPLGNTRDYGRGLVHAPRA